MTIKFINPNSPDVSEKILKTQIIINLETLIKEKSATLDNLNRTA
jgi:hypothetical protein